MRSTAVRASMTRNDASDIFDFIISASTRISGLGFEVNCVSIGLCISLLTVKPRPSTPGIRSQAWPCQGGHSTSSSARPLRLQGYPARRRRLPFSRRRFQHSQITFLPPCFHPPGLRHSVHHSHHFQAKRKAFMCPKRYDICPRVPSIMTSGVSRFCGKPRAVNVTVMSFRMRHDFIIH